MKRLVVAALVALALAGCSGGSPPADVEEPFDSAKWSAQWDALPPDVQEWLCDKEPRDVVPFLRETGMTKPDAEQFVVQVGLECGWTVVREGVRQ